MKIFLLQVITSILVIVLSNKVIQARPQEPPTDQVKELANNVSATNEENAVTNSPDASSALTTSGTENKSEPVSAEGVLSLPANSNTSKLVSRSLSRNKDIAEDAPLNFGKRLGTIKKYVRMYDDILKKIDEALEAAVKRLGVGLVDIGQTTKRGVQPNPDKPDLPVSQDDDRY